MKIAIIGGGWIGCHLASKLRALYNVSLFEKNCELFLETSSHNQNRLHLGYHYARSYATRKLCLETFNRFLLDYEFLTKPIKHNLYCVPLKDSILDFETYKHIFNTSEIVEFSHSFCNIEGCIDTKERYIDFNKARAHFNNSLSDIITCETIDLRRLKQLKEEYDLVIDATNNHLQNNLEGSFYELTLSLTYQNIKKAPFGAMTLVDGPLFSIYPYKEDIFTVTDVEHTPIKSFSSIQELKAFKQSIHTSLVEDRRQRIESKIKNYYPNFPSHFRYNDYFLSTKTKKTTMSADRYPVILVEDNLISCFTGKIQGIYIIEDFIVNEINNRL